MRAKPITTLGTVIFAAFFTFLMVLPIGAQEPKIEDSLRDLPGSNPHSLIGTWSSQVVITNCSGVTLQTFSKLVSFNEGGTATEVSTGAPAAARTTALGIWENTGFNTFRYALQFYRFNPDGTFAGSSRAKWTVTVSQFGDSYMAEAQVELINPAGTVVANLCGTETATRFNPF